MARYSFQPRNSLLPCFSLYFPRLRALLREISPFIFSSLPFSHSVKAFPIRFFPFFIICPIFIFPFISFPLLIHPTLFAPSPLSLAFLPTFPTLSPINARTRAPSRITHVCVRAHTPARQEVFVYCLHPFTHLTQFTVHQRIRCEGKQEKALTKRATNSLSINYTQIPDFIHRDPHLSPR